MKATETSSDHEETGDDQTSQLPVDKKWAWVVLIASFVNLFVANGSFRSFGIVFPEIQRKFGANASTASLIAALNQICFGLSTMLVQTIGLWYFSTRQTVMLGSLIMCITYVISAFSPVVELLIVFQGAIPGIAAALIIAPTYILIGDYFDKKRGFALCLCTTGGSVGLFAFSFLTRICLDEYGFTGTLLMTGAISLHGLVSGALQRPMHFYTRNITGHAKKVEDRTDDKHDLDQVKDGDTSMKNTDEKAMSPLLNGRSPSLTRTSKTSGTYSQTSQGSMVLNEQCYHESNEFISFISDINAKTDVESDGTVTEEQSRFQKFKAKFGTMFSADAIKRPVFLVCLFSGCLLSIACSLTVMFLPAHAKDIGFSDKQASLLVTMISITDTVAIPLWGILADKRWLHTRNIAVLAATVLGVTMYFMPLFTSFNAMVFFSLVYGLFGRVWFSMSTLLLVDMIGIAKLKSALGILLLSQTATISVFTYVIGAMRDALGSYIPGFQLMATVLIAGAIGLLSLRLVEKFDRETKTDDKAIKVDEP